jgi:hypothetical protein
MMTTYYDINLKDEFDDLFAGTWIHENPTEDRGSYLILPFDFSGVPTVGYDVRHEFHKHCKFRIEFFLQDYANILPVELINSVKNAETVHDMLIILCKGLNNLDLNLYIFIDEYDNFANSLIANKQTELYLEMTKGTGFFTEFFKNLKTLTTGGNPALKRIIITGVSPITMEDVASGFNIGDNISLNLNFNGLVGFTEQDVLDIFDYFTSIGRLNINKTEALYVMKKWYDNYRFNLKAGESVFNTDGVWHFFKNSIRQKDITPDLIDDNLRVDYNKLIYLLQQDKEMNGNFKKLTELVENGGIASNVRKSFPLVRLIERENYISFMYFLGFITFSGEIRNDRPFLKIPNETIKTITFEYIMSALKSTYQFSIDLDKLLSYVGKMAYDGNFKLVFEFIEKEIARNTSVRDYIERENLIKTFYAIYLNFYDYYITGTEIEMNKGYADLVLKPFYERYKNMKYSYLIEFKYIKRDVDGEKLQSEIESLTKVAKTQLDKYVEDDIAQKMFGLPPYGVMSLKKLIVIFHGWEMLVCEEYGGN